MIEKVAILVGSTRIEGRPCYEVPTMKLAGGCGVRSRIPMYGGYSFFAFYAECKLAIK